MDEVRGRGVVRVKETNERMREGKREERRVMERKLG